MITRDLSSPLRVTPHCKTHEQIKLLGPNALIRQNLNSSISKIASHHADMQQILPQMGQFDTAVDVATRLWEPTCDMSDSFDGGTRVVYKSVSLDVVDWDLRSMYLIWRQPYASPGWLEISRPTTVNGRVSGRNKPDLPSDWGKATHSNRTTCRRLFGALAY